MIFQLQNKVEMKEKKVIKIINNNVFQSVILIAVPKLQGVKIIYLRIRAACLLENSINKE